MRVLIVIVWDGGGVATAMRNVATHLRADGVSFSAFCFNGFAAGSRWGEFCDDLYSNSQLSLTELLVNETFDVIHVLEEAGPEPYSANLWLDRAGFTGGVVCMSQNSIHPMEPEQFAHVYIACSEASRDAMRKYVSKPIRVIPNGADAEHFKPIALPPADVPARPVLAWVGRSTDLRQKDVYAFLHLAAALAGESDPGYDFWIADADPSNAQQLRLAEWFGDRVLYRHELNRDELVVFYNRVAASGGAVISTSAYEGMPFALLEASACGCPVIAPRAPGLEYIGDGRSGLLYDRKDGLAGLKGCVARLKDAALRRSLVDAALADVGSAYNSRAMAAKYFQALADAQASAGRGQSRLTTAWAAMRGEFYMRAIRAMRLFRRFKAGLA